MAGLVPAIPIVFADNRDPRDKPAGDTVRVANAVVSPLSSLAKWLWRCELALLYAGILATFAMMCLTSADALSRYLLNRPIMGAYEITEKYLMVAAIFLGLSYAYRGGVFIRVTFLVDRLQAIVRGLVTQAAEARDLHAIREVFDRVAGPPPLSAA